MNLLTFYCGLMMFLITAILIFIRVKTGNALNARGRPVSEDDDPIMFWVLIIFNFAFLLSISIAMIVLAFYVNPYKLF